MKKSRTESRPKTLAKSATGIRGFDEITGGLPAGRPTLICGGTGCGKTMLAMEFLVRGATDHDEPGVFMAFEVFHAQAGGGKASGMTGASSKGPSKAGL